MSIDEYKTLYNSLIAKHTDGTTVLTNVEFSNAVNEKFPGDTNVETALQKTIDELTDKTNVNPENEKISEIFFVDKMNKFQQIVDNANANPANPGPTVNPTNPTVNPTNPTEAYIIVNFDKNAYSVDETNSLSFNDKKFPVKITIVPNCTPTLQDKQRCFEFDGVSYQIDWSDNIRNESDIDKKMLVETFLTPNVAQSSTNANVSGSTTTNANVSGTTTNGAQSGTTTNVQSGTTTNAQNTAGQNTAGIKQQIDDDKITEFLSVPENINCIKELLDNANTLTFDTIMQKIHCIIIICSINVSKKQDIITQIANDETDFNTKYGQMVEKIINVFETENNDTKNASITNDNTKTFYNMQIVLIAIGQFDGEIMKSINTKSETYNNASVSPSNTILNISNPNNSNYSCWLNSILMALLVPKLLECSTSSTPSSTPSSPSTPSTPSSAQVDCVKGKLNLTNGEIFSENLAKYIGTYFSDSNKHNDPAGKQALQNMKTELLSSNPDMIDNLNNIDTFLRSEFFSSIFNTAAISTTLTDSTTNDFNFINLSAIDDVEYNKDEKTVKTTRTDGTGTSVNYSYKIDTTAINYIVFVADVDEKKLKDTVHNLFLGKKIVFSDATYTLKSFVLGSGGHYIALIENGTEYVKVDDLPNDVNEGIKSETISIDEIIKKDNAYDTNYYPCAYIFVKDETPTGTPSTGPQTPPPPPPPSGTSGGSRKNRLRKSKKTKRKYYIYK